ncbi:MAG: DUF354 domain-containing protein [Oscillospiraceae bacterium]|nr:DUF354 domain-containing protein [Oscillospiraceae bacterium]
MKIAFRIDISKEIGTGHFYRMNALADVFIEMKHECVFFKSEDEPINFTEFNIIILDTYEVSDNYIASLNSNNTLLVCYDDNALYKYNCDVLLNANFYAHELMFTFGNKIPKLLLGGKYALLRREFRDSIPLEIREKAKNIFICFGGSDARNITPDVIRSLKEIENVNISVVLGAYTSNDDEVYALSAVNITVYKTPEKIYDIMQNCDIAVAASGSMIYEFSAIGMPTILITQAENQLLSADYLVNNNIAVCSGNWDNIDYNRLKNDVKMLLCDYKKRCEFSQRMLERVDKNGAKNAAVEIMNIYNSREGHQN